MATIFLSSSKSVNTFIPDSYGEFLACIHDIFKCKLSSMAGTDQLQFVCTGKDIASGTPVHFTVTESNFKNVARCSSIILSVRLYFNVFAEEDGKASTLQDGVRIAYDTKCGFDAEFSAAIDQALEGYVLRYKQKHPRSSVLSSNCCGMRSIAKHILVKNRKC